MYDSEHTYSPNLAITFVSQADQENGPNLNVDQKVNSRPYSPIVPWVIVVSTHLLYEDASWVNGDGRARLHC